MEESDQSDSSCSGYGSRTSSSGEPVSQSETACWKSGQTERNVVVGGKKVVGEKSPPMTLRMYFNVYLPTSEW